MDDHLTLRLPRALARALDRWARSRGLPRSHVVREAVARYLDPSPEPTVAVVTAAALAHEWPRAPRLTADEAAAFERDMVRARSDVPGVRPATWE